MSGGEAPGTHLRVVRGNPTPEELAAVVVALGDLLAPTAAAPPRPAWLRAARLEGLGQRPVSDGADLRGRR